MYCLAHNQIISYPFFHGYYAVFDVRNAKVSDQTVWAKDLKSYPVKLDEANGDVSVMLDHAQNEETGQQTPTEKQKVAEAQENDRKFYEEEDRKASHKQTLKLISKVKLEETDIMTFKLQRGGLEYSAGQFGYFKLDGVTGDPKGPIRHFSLASSPTEHDYILISTRIRDTPYKKMLASLSDSTEV